MYFLRFLTKKAILSNNYKRKYLADVASIPILTRGLRVFNGTVSAELIHLVSMGFVPASSRKS